MSSKSVTTAEAVHTVHAEHAHAPEPVPPRQEAGDDGMQVHLSWRSWLVVFLACFAIMTQVFVVVAAGSVIAFIVRDLGDAAIAGWVIQGPLLMQSVLSPLVGRLSDVLDRKYLAAGPPLIAFVGAVVSAKATSMRMLVGGGVLIGTTLSTIAIVQAIPSEVLPLKYRALANGLAFLGGAVGGVVGSLGAGAVTNVAADGWRYIFWMQAAFHGATSLGLFLFYWPAPRAPSSRMTLRACVWACDPVGALLFVASATLMLLALDWASGTYAWSDAHVAAPLAAGLALLVLFGLYEWQGRRDGLLAHVFFRHNANFGLAVFAFAVEGWIFYSAVNAVVPQIVLNLGFASGAWAIALRQLSYTLVTMVASVPITLWATRRKDLKRPLLATFVLFFAVAVGYAALQPSWDHAQIALSVLAGIGQSGPLTLLVACVQFTAPHAYLSTATGLAFSARAIGGAFGSAVLDAIINSYLHKHYAADVGHAAVAAGLPRARVADLLAALAAGTPGDRSMASPHVWAVAVATSRSVYAHAYRLAWASVIPFVVLATVAVGCLRGVRELMTDKVEATVERVERVETEAEKV